MNATQYPPMCAQRSRTKATDPSHLFRVHISEDCLYLNVFAPPQFTNDTYPVVVYIHGGGFQSGSSSDYPQDAILNNFVSRKIIFISLNYRLGPLGFLSTGDEVLPGNFGLWDQILALQWVKVCLFWRSKLKKSREEVPGSGIMDPLPGTSWLTDKRRS